MEWKLTTFEYSEDGVSVRVPGVYAWVCPEHGEIDYTPEIAEGLNEAVRELIATAKRARVKKTMPSEYIVSVA